MNFVIFLEYQSLMEGRYIKDCKVYELCEYDFDSDIEYALKYDKALDYS